MKNHGNELDRLVAQMKYGIVGINIYPVFSYPYAQLRWGAFPGKTDSGSGFIGNTRLYNNLEKAVLRVPFNWLGHKLVGVNTPKRSELVFSRLTRYKLRPNLFTQIPVFTALFLGL